MAEELRLALSLLGSLAVGAVVLHGIWTVRKNSLDERKQQAELDKNEEPELDQEEQETQALRIKQMEIDFSELAGQDQEGGLPVSQVNVDSIYKDSHDQNAHGQATHNQYLSSNEEPIVEGTTQAPSDLINSDLENSDLVNSAQGQLYDAEITNEANPSSFDTSHEQMGEFLTHARNVTANPSTPSSSSTSTNSDDAPELNRFSSEDSYVENQGNEPFIDSFSALDDADDERVEPKVTLEEPKAVKEEKAPEVLILFVDKPDGEMIEGAKLLPLLLTLGFKFGEMDFFHRHEQSSGHGEVLFSLANMYNPGTFDIDHMEQVATRGLSIFMTLPNAGEALQTFNMMHNAAKKIADEFGARVLDAERKPLDVVRVRNYVDKIRKF